MRLEPFPWAPGRTFAVEERARLASSGLWPVTLDLADEAAAIRGVRIARPFFDRRVVEFCLGLPRAHKTAMGVTKVVLRRALEHRLPAEVAERTAKANLSAAFSTGLSRSGGEAMRQGLSLAEANRGAWLDPTQIARKREHGWTGRDVYQTYRAAWIGWWLEWLAADAQRGTRPDDRTPVVEGRWWQP